MPYFDKAVETMPRERLQALQLDKLRVVISQLLGRNRFYTNKWKEAGAAPGDIRSLADLQALPFTSKSELVQAQADAPPFGTNSTFPETEYTRFHQTSGTTGAPLRVLDTPESWDWWGKCWGFVFSGAGVTSADRLFLAFGFGPFIGFWAAVEGAKRVGATMIPGGGWDSLQRLHMMRELRATAICCTPTYALRLADVARQENFDLSSIPIRRLVHAGEPGANVAHTKARIEAAWGGKCFDHAGASEVGAHSFECEVQPGGIHVIESEFIAEVIDPQTGREALPGAIGELVITNMGRPGFPVIRYRTGDLVRMNLSPCTCGRTFARLDGGLLGRSDDMVTIRGVNVYPTAIENVIRQFAEVEEFQITVTRQREMQDLEIQIEVANAADAESLPRYEMKARRFRRLDG